MKKETDFQVYILLMLLIAFWALSWPISKIGLQYMPPLWLAASRLLLGTFSMFISVLFLKKLILPTRQDLKIIFTIGLMQVGLFMLLIILGLSYVQPGRAAVLVYTTPIWVVPISVIFFKEQTSLRQWIGVLLGLVGTLILFNPFEINWSDHNELIGNAILLFGALIWAISILCARHMLWTRSPLELISWQLLVGTIPAIVAAIIFEPHPMIFWNTSLTLALLYLGIFATAFAYWGTVVVSKELSPITTSLSLLLVPVLGLILSALIVDEAITKTLVIALLFTLSGMLFVIKRRRPA